ncbi:MAG: acyl-CoA dehydrogenase, partial [Candidatus Obscuribacterales bacterium]|nr:acyl-CoA dehydrogenase [Candidatus Obscuribacterales bacterium]
HLLIASGALGVASRALDHALSYSKQRHTFGRPISQHQGVSFMLADMAREIEAARLLIRHAAKLIDNNQVAYDKAASAKAFAQDVAMKVTTDAVQIYGGYGYSKEYPVEKLMRDALIYKLSEQSANELKAAHARHLLGSTKRS